MEFLLPLMSLAAVQLLAVISPGQSFVVVLKLALSQGRSSAMAATVGMGVGSVIWATAAISGFAIILKQAAWLYSTLKFIGGAYLLFLAVMLWRHALEELKLEGRALSSTSIPSAFILGLLTRSPTQRS